MIPDERAVEIARAHFCETYPKYTGIQVQKVEADGGVIRVRFFPETKRLINFYVSFVAEIDAQSGQVLGMR